jgi:hypothetical protein
MTREPAVDRGENYHQIKWDSRARVVAKGKYCRTNENLMLCNCWGIPDRIIV